MLETISQFWGQYGGLLLEGTRDTLIMVFISTLFAYVIGLPWTPPRPCRFWIC